MNTPVDNNSPPGPLPPFNPWQPNRPSRGSPPWRTIIMIAGAALLITLILLAVIAIARRPRPATTEPDPKTAVAIADEWLTSAVVVRSGEVMPVVLGRSLAGLDLENQSGLPDEFSARVIAALGAGGFSFHRMRPGDTLTVLHRKPDNWRVRYRAGQLRTWQVELGPPDRVGMLIPRVERLPAEINGSISSSLWNALIEQGERPALVLEYARILGWEVDFFTETQVGDSFFIYATRLWEDSVIIGYEPPVGIRYQGAAGEFVGIRYTDPDGRTDYFNTEGQSLRKSFLKSPLDFARVTSFFGRRFHPIHRTWRQHHGVDYAAPPGTPVSTVAEGRIVRAGWHGGYGNCVDIRHPGGYLTRYGHLSRFGQGVRVGTSVNQGQLIGYVGSTGTSTGPHLHFELHADGTPMNPLRFDPPRVEPVKPEYLADFSQARDSTFRLALGLKPRQ